MASRVLGFKWVAGSIACAIVCIPCVLNAGVVLFKDNFNCYTNGEVITSFSNYSYANFPAGGTSKTNNPFKNPSKLWEMDTGNARVVYSGTNGWLFFGTPIEFGREFVRFNSRRFDLGDAEFSWKYRSGPFGGPDGFEPVLSPEAVDLWVRYQTQYNLYVVQFDRTNNVVVAKRKVPADTNFVAAAGLPARTISNNGVYYVIYTDSESPGGASNRFASWPPGMTNLLHDTNTVYEFKVTVVTKTNGTVQIKLRRGGTNVASWTDNSDGLDESSGKTLAHDLAKGYYTNVTGWKEEWGGPITMRGATGFRADNIKLWIDDFQVSSLETNDSKLKIAFQGGKVVLEWTGTTLQSSDDLKTWKDEDCEVSPLSVTPAGMKFYRVKN